MNKLFFLLVFFGFIPVGLRAMELVPAPSFTPENQVPLLSPGYEAKQLEKHQLTITVADHEEKIKALIQKDKEKQKTIKELEEKLAVVGEQLQELMKTARSGGGQVNFNDNMYIAKSKDAVIISGNAHLHHYYQHSLSPVRLWGITRSWMARQCRKHKSELITLGVGVPAGIYLYKKIIG